MKLFRLIDSYIQFHTVPNYQIEVRVIPQYQPEQSSVDDSVYVFSYTISIKNTGKVAAQLISRKWLIADTGDFKESVEGLGVVGHQPLIHPGQTFEYTSSATLPSPSGSMRGSYFFVAIDGTRFDVEIEAFILSAITADSMEHSQTLH